jgi:hypothetical protein
MRAKLKVFWLGKRTTITFRFETLGFATPNIGVSWDVLGWHFSITIFNLSLWINSLKYEYDEKSVRDRIYLNVPL